MKYLDDSNLLPDALVTEAGQSTSDLESQLLAIEERERELDASADLVERADVQLQKARVLGALERGEEAWPLAREAFDVFLAAENWEKAVEACDVLFLANQEDSLAALGQGVWLGVTFPIDPELTIAMLQHIVDETPDDSDGAAVAGATACYIADLRCEEDSKDKENLTFFAGQMLGTVARRHSEIESKEQFDFWVEKMELDQPDKFLVRLRNVVDVLVQENWWFDRDELRERLPVN